ncbi:ATP-binding protein [Streptomyces monticola]|uniref:ATP-binding protein n=1 Tax=Streptomyces monticola TaxID=2666263 RepID=A0ABW2JAJ8_9ACTN
MDTLGDMKAQIPASAVQFRQLFSATPRGARLARRLTAHQLEEWGFPHGSETSDAAASIVAELAANAVTHGRVPGRDFEVRLVNGRGVLRIEVTDARGDRRPEVAAKPPEADAEGGRGLCLVAALAKEWGVRERAVGKTVWAELSVNAMIAGGGLTPPSSA